MESGLTACVEVDLLEWSETVVIEAHVVGGVILGRWEVRVSGGKGEGNIDAIGSSARRRRRVEAWLWMFVERDGRNVSESGI